MLITTNMGIQVDPIGLNNVSINLMRYVRPNLSSVQRTRRCLFGRPDPDQNKRIYENSVNNERNRCIERYGFDPVKSEFVEKVDENRIDNNETVNIETNIQQCLDNVVVKQSDDIVKDSSTSESEKDIGDVKDVQDVKDVIKYKLQVDHVQGPRTQLMKRPHESERKKTAFNAGYGTIDD
ncbi:hypothetical protein Bhyg_10651 [Pseudolycoriella hygida]|uniref:Uncharacterized protein n=1 Tax=Pseudolycoriella hygida TaxID=35572 RepID=A0A9Q0RXK7_9DIPT|nr:hypothetical protein Bhyg_10651 [Pseudolycoriella hygida]